MRQTYQQKVLAEHLPLEQGLRRLVLLVDEDDALVLAEHLPLEQGLRLAMLLLVIGSTLDSQSIFH